MEPGQDREQAVGIQYYVSDTPGIGGRLRARPSDFRVRELEGIEPQPVEADPDDYPYLVFRAELRNWDTNAFARELGNRLGVSRERIGWAGTKDRRAVTTQLFSIDHVDPDDLPVIDGAEIDVVGRFGRDLFFGDLLGNAFEITVRDPDDPDNVGAITDELVAFLGREPNENAEPVIGVPNFFGLQRFGSRRPVTHEVGHHILARDWEQAVMTYLTATSPDEPDESRRVREQLASTRDWSAALNEYPHRLGYERAMLNVLAGDGSFQEALAALPENLQRLFVHAVQSEVCNRILSRRLETGLSFTDPVPGDVVCFTTDHEQLSVPDTDRLQRVTEQNRSVIQRHCRRGRAVVTAPLVGTETTLADGDVGEIEAAAVDAVGVTPSDFDLPEPYHSTGTRRAVLVTTAITVDVGDGTVEFGFALPKGSYATVVLREYLKSASY